MTNELLSRGEVLVAGDVIRARQVANQIVLRDAINKFGVKKIFTFHRSVKSAQSFVSRGGEGINAHVASLSTYHVNGEMPTADRERLMRSFREAITAMMSNARCLTEGVDVPAVDMVAFLSPRHSRVDIAQAIGRAMRRSPGKSLGYVLVPLYVEQAAGESVEDAIERAQFDEISEVLQSLQEQDEVLADMIRDAAEQKAKVKGFNDTGFADRIEFIGPALSLESLRRVVAARCIENLYVPWDIWMGKLKMFKERFGHCNVPYRWSEDPKLGSWVVKQRKFKKKGFLSAERVRKLDQIGFCWSSLDYCWDENFAKMKAFKEKHGDCIPSNKAEPELTKWAYTQRRKYHRGELEPERKAKLDSIGFIWSLAERREEMREETWGEMCAEFEKYPPSQRNGNLPVSNKRLAVWSNKQRFDRKAGTLSQERIQRLDQLGFNWEQQRRERRTLEQYLSEFAEFRAKHGHCHVPIKYRENPRLGALAGELRVQRKKGVLFAERIAKLDELGFMWSGAKKVMDDGLSEPWRTWFADLLRYKEVHGNCDVPMHWKEDKQLANWVDQQRQLYKRGSLHATRVKLLEEAGFSWGGS